MAKSMLFFIAVLIVALGARPVLAGDERTLVLVTTNTTPADIGVVGMHDMCDAELPGTHFCSSSDIIRNGALPGALPDDEAWVHPSIRGYAVLAEGPPELLFVVDASGVASDGVLSGELSCRSWTDTFEGLRGLFIGSGGGFGRLPCDFELQVACCGEPINLHNFVFPPPGPSDPR